MTNNQPSTTSYERLGYRILAVVGVASLVATLVTLGLIIFDLAVLAAIVGTATIALYLMAIVTTTAIISSHRTVRIMKEGASIALQAQEFNDQWDTQKAKVFADIFTQGAKVSAAHRPSALPSGTTTTLPPLPLPSQDTSWVPSLSATTIEADEEQFDFEE